ncbi:MAG: Gldg family protein [Myxococcales bacterium]|nr:Gldg family protein [Myxococcales bacterium]
MASKSKARMASESTLFLIVLAAIAVLVNMLGVAGVKVRTDVTRNELFSLSEGSKRLAAGLDDQMEIRAYFSKELPPPFNATARYVRDMLSEYRDASKGKIILRMIEPESEEEQKAAERDGVQRVADRTFEDDAMGIKEGYRGISFHYLGDTKSIGRVDTTAGLEYEITQRIKQMMGEKVEIGVLGGHEGPTPSEGLAAIKEYMATYTLAEVQATSPIDAKYKALLILHPTTPLTDVELRHIDQYVMKGGSLGVFGGSIKLDLGGQQGGDPSAQPIDAGLNTLLEKWGVSIDNRIVADAQCGQARMPSPIPGLAIPVPYPPVPIASFDEKQREHPALFRINQVAMPYPVRVAINDQLKGDKEVTHTVLARSTEQSWLMEGDTIDLKARERWQVPGYNGPFNLGVAIEGKLPSAYAAAAVSSEPADPSKPTANIQAPERAETNVRVLVFGTGFFMRDEFLPKPQPGMPGFPGAVAFALNAIDWLTQDSDLIAIRAKNIEEPMLEVPKPVKEAEAVIREAIEEKDEGKAQAAFDERKEAMKAWDKRKDSYRWGNTLAIPLAFALIGVVRWRVRRARKANLKL